MRITSISDEDIYPGSFRKVLGAPDGDLTNDDIRPAEALVHFGDGDVPHFQFRVELEPGDIQKLLNDKPIWITMLGGVPPFSVDIAE